MLTRRLPAFVRLVRLDLAKPKYSIGFAHHFIVVEG